MSGIEITRAAYDGFTGTLEQRVADFVAALEAHIHAAPWTTDNFREAIAAGYSTRVGERDGRIVAYGVLMLILVMYLILGCLMDAMAMIILTVPIVFPIIVQLGFDPIWFGIIIVMTVELGLIHPPVGMNVFVIKSVVHDVSFMTIFKGVIPFVLTDLLRLVILIAFPIIALWLPERMG
jgi:hypothetical protein